MKTNLEWCWWANDCLNFFQFLCITCHKYDFFRSHCGAEKNSRFSTHKALLVHLEFFPSFCCDSTWSLWPISTRVREESEGKYVSNYTFSQHFLKNLFYLLLNCYNFSGQHEMTVTINDILWSLQESNAGNCPSQVPTDYTVCSTTFENWFSCCFVERVSELTVSVYCLKLFPTTWNNCLSA